MKPSPYCRPALPDADPCAPGPADVAGDWLDRLDLTVERLEDGCVDPDTAYDLLAGWAGLRRLRPELLEGEDAARVRRAIEERLRSSGDVVASEDLVASDYFLASGAVVASEDLLEGEDVARVRRAIEDRLRSSGDVVASALDVPDPESWLEEVERLARLDEEEDPTSLERAALARQILEDLDDAELVEHAARVLGRPDDALREALDRCAERVAEDPAPFLAAAHWIRVSAEALRPDLAEVDPDLALTAAKFVVLLDALEDALASLSYEGQSFLSEEAARDLLAGRPRPALPRLPTYRPTFAIAAAATGPEAVPLVFESLDGSWEARLDLPPETRARDDFEVQLRVRGAPDAVAASLAGVESPLVPGEGGRTEARFSLGELRRTWDDPSFETIELVRRDGTRLRGRPRP